MEVNRHCSGNAGGKIVNMIARSHRLGEEEDTQNGTQFQSHQINKVHLHKTFDNMTAIKRTNNYGAISQCLLPYRVSR